MRGSSTLARVITIVIAVIVTPIATGLLAQGGYSWLYFVSTRREFDFTVLAGPLLLQVVAVALLLGVIATGIWSSAGLIAVGVLTVVPVALNLFPQMLMGLYSSPIPREWLDGTAYGLPSAIFPVLGAMGVVLALVRRAPRSPGAAMGVVGIVVAPLLLLAGGWLLAWGIGRGSLMALVMFRTDFAPDAAAALLAGVALIAAGVLVTRWSPFALVLPAVALIILTLLYMQPMSPFSTLLFDTSMEIGRVLPTLFIFGGGVMAALAYLVFTAVLLMVRSRARSRLAAAGPGAGFAVPGQYPAAYPPAGYAPGGYAPAGYPAAPQYPAAPNAHPQAPQYPQAPNAHQQAPPTQQHPQAPQYPQAPPRYPGAL